MKTCIVLVIVAFCMLQISMLFSTVWLHRCLTHRALQLNLGVKMFMHLWISVLTGLDPQRWVVVHRMHHCSADKAGDPHSPRTKGFWNVALLTPWLYHKACTKAAILKFGKGYMPDLIDKLPLIGYRGISGLLLLSLLWGWRGIIVWALHDLGFMLTYGILNAVAHRFGSRPQKAKDYATNDLPLALLTAGEGWHYNHHEHQAEAKFGKGWKQPDTGWIFIRLLSWLKLARLT